MSKSFLSHQSRFVFSFILRFFQAQLCHPTTHLCHVFFFRKPGPPRSSSLSLTLVGEKLHRVIPCPQGKKPPFFKSNCGSLPVPTFLRGKRGPLAGRFQGGSNRDRAIWFWNLKKKTPTTNSFICLVPREPNAQMWFLGFSTAKMTTEMLGKCSLILVNVGWMFKKISPLRSNFGPFGRSLFTWGPL